MEPNNIEFPIDYDELYVAFVDILGFSALTFKSDRDSRIKLQRCIDRIDKLAEHFEVGRLKMLFISDAIILSIPKDENSLAPLCQLIDGIQNILLRIGLVSRGAISMGEAKISSSDIKIFGPAYIQAFELEKRAAVFPRVIIDPKIFTHITRTKLIQEVVSNGRQWLTSSERSQSRRPFIHQDHFLFVDYLITPILGKDIEAIDQIYEIVKNGLYSSKTWAIKYQWLKDYMLFSLNRFLDRDRQIFQPIYDRFVEL